MPFFNSGKWKQWAQEWGFVHSPQTPLAYRNEWIAGMRDHRLVKVAWGGQKGSRLFIIIRFAGSLTSGSIREGLRQDESLAALPGWKRLKPMPEAKRSPAGAGRPSGPGADYERPGFKLNAFVQHDLVVDDKSMVWSHAISWGRPKPEKVRGWVEALLQSLSRTTQGFDDRCEMCGTGRVNGFVLFEGLPMMICPGCREQTKLQGQMAEQRYEQGDSNVLMGLLLGAAGAVIGGIAWAAFAMWTERIYAAVALGIGMLVAWGYKLGARKLDRFGQIAGAALTLGGVVVGDVLLYAWQVSRSRPDIGFRLDVGWAVFVELLQTSPADIILTMVFGAVGATIAIRWLRKPRFTPRIESPEESAATKKAA